MNIVRYDEGDAIRLAVRGELDISTADQLTDEVALVLDTAPRRLILDAAGLTFCDSTGLDALLTARQQAGLHEVAFRVTGPQGIVRRSMEVTGLLGLLTGEPAD